MQEPLTLNDINKFDMQMSGALKGGGVSYPSNDAFALWKEMQYDNSYIEFSCIEMDISLAITYCKNIEAFEVVEKALQRARG